MQHPDWDPDPVSQPAELEPPQPSAGAVGPARVGGDREDLRVRVARLPEVLPPGADRRGSELLGVCTDPDADPAFVEGEVVNAEDPDEVVFETKPELKSRADRACSRVGYPKAPVLGDSAYAENAACASGFTTPALLPLKPTRQNNEPNKTLPTPPHLHGLPIGLTTCYVGTC